MPCKTTLPRILVNDLSSLKVRVITKNKQIFLNLHLLKIMLCDENCISDITLMHGIKAKISEASLHRNKAKLENLKVRGKLGRFSLVLLPCTSVPVYYILHFKGRLVAYLPIFKRAFNIRYEVTFLDGHPV